MIPFGDPGHLPAGGTGDGQPLHETVLDVGTQRVARVYAEALLGAATQQGKADEVLEEFETLVGPVFHADLNFEAFFASGAIGRDRKAQVIHSLFDGKASDVFINGLLVLNDHERLDLLRPIAQAYREMRDQRAGRMRVQVSSAIPLAEDQQEKLRQELRAAFDKEPILDVQVDPDLLGGMVVRVGDWLYDHSVRTQLESIRHQLIARSSYEIQSGRDRFSTPVGN
jgi:F-type H+-transporting ATPase subunit delta